MNQEVPQELEWVKVRAECTLRRILKRLRDEIMLDVAQRNQYLTDSQKDGHIGFELEDDEAKGEFLVIRNGQGIHVVFTFGIVGSEIYVSDGAGATILKATIGMNDSGRCVLRVNGCGVETWQFRKKTLEDLFFWY
jgi:hypothetical protein